MDSNLIIAFPSRCVGNGTAGINSGETVAFPGTHGRQRRRQIIITNLNVANDLKLQNVQGRNLLTIFPRVALTLETSDDLQLYNISGVVIQYEVCEVFYDAGTPGTPTYAEAPRSGIQASGGGGNAAFHGLPSGSGGVSRGYRP